MSWMTVKRQWKISYVSPGKISNASCWGEASEQHGARGEKCAGSRVQLFPAAAASGRRKDGRSQHGRTGAGRQARPHGKACAGRPLTAAPCSRRGSAPRCQPSARRGRGEALGPAQAPRAERRGLPAGPSVRARRCGAAVLPAGERPRCSLPGRRQTDRSGAATRHKVPQSRWHWESRRHDARRSRWGTASSLGQTSSAQTGNAKAREKEGAGCVREGWLWRPVPGCDSASCREGQTRRSGETAAPPASAASVDGPENVGPPERPCCAWGAPGTEGAGPLGAALT